MFFLKEVSIKMKKRIILALSATFIFYGLMVFVSGFKDVLGFVPVTPPVTPATPPTVNTEGKATGGVQATAGSATLKLDFNAHGGTSVKGNVNYSNSLGDRFMGKVDLCYVQSGNEAVFAGTVNKGTVSEQYFLVEVQDNGEGKKMTSPDALRVRLFNDKPDCTLSGAFPGLVTKGNIQVHE